MRPSAALLALALLAIPAAPRAAPDAREGLLVGLVPEVNVFKQKARFKLLGEYLGHELGVPVQFTILARYGNILESFEARRIDGAFFGSFTGAIAVERFGAVPLARPVNLDGSSTYRGLLFVRKDSAVRTVAAMRGKRMAFVDRATTAGFVFPLAWLREQGVASPAGFFGEYWFTGSHDAAVDAVLDGKADVGVAKDTVFERMRGANPRIDRELLVLAESPPVPSNGLLVREGLAPELVEALRRALLALERAPAGAGILAQLGALRFIETRAGDYQPVLDLAAKAGIDPKRVAYVEE